MNKFTKIALPLLAVLSVSTANAAIDLSAIETSTLADVATAGGVVLAIFGAIYVYGVVINLLKKGKSA